MELIMTDKKFTELKRLALPKEVKEGKKSPNEYVFLQENNIYLLM